jgi:hypothetical protein
LNSRIGTDARASALSCNPDVFHRGHGGRRFLSWIRTFSIEGTAADVFQLAIRTFSIEGTAANVFQLAIRTFSIEVMPADVFQLAIGRFPSVPRSF